MKNIDEFVQVLEEISSILKNINCALSDDGDVSYKIMLNGEFTGISLTVFATEDNEYYVLAVMENQMPEIDLGFKKYLDFTNKINEPNILVLYKNNKEKIVLFEFIFRSVYYFETSKMLRKWHCCDCGEIGIEYFLKDGSIATIDADNNEFKLIITDDKDDQRAVFDDHIDEYVIPICQECSVKAELMMSGSVPNIFS